MMGTCYGSKRWRRGIGFFPLLFVFAACAGGGGDGNVLSELPAMVFSGGGGALTLRMETTDPATLHATFEEWEEQGNGQVTVLQSLAAGSHELTVEVPTGTYLYFELTVPAATPGARLEWTVLLDGQVVVQQDDTLDEPLQGDLVFSLEFAADDVADVREWTR